MYKFEKKITHTSVDGRKRGWQFFFVNLAFFVVKIEEKSWKSVRNYPSLIVLNGNIRRGAGRWEARVRVIFSQTRPLKALPFIVLVRWW